MALLKNVLGVRVSTCNAAVYRELGLLPLHVFAYQQAIKYWNNLQKNDDDRLSLLSYQQLVLAAAEGKANWAGHIEVLLNSYGYKEAFNNPQGFVTNKSVFECMNKIKLEYETNIDMTIYNSRKLDLYDNVKIVEYKMPDYFSYALLKGQRKALTQLRLSAHRLEVEVGRLRLP